MTEVYIYALCDPDTKEIRYIGKTRNLKKRFQGHMGANKNRQNLYSQRWIKSLVQDGKKPVLKVLEVTDEENWQECEKLWIREAKEQGAKLTNITPGGEGTSIPMSPERKQLLISIHTGRKNTPETRAKMSASMRGVRRSDETRAKMSQTRKGQVPHNKGKPTPEHLRKQSSLAQRTLTSEQADEIKRLRQSGKTQREVAELFQVSQGTISRICHGHYDRYTKREDA